MKILKIHNEFKRLQGELKKKFNELSKIEWIWENLSEIKQIWEQKKSGEIERI